MSDFNSDNAKLDAVLKEHDDALAALEAENTALQTALAGKGNCQIYTTTYTGTGTGENSFTFPSKPLAVMVMGGGIWLCVLQGQTIGQSRNGRTSSDYVDVTWSGSSVTWAVDNDMSLQCNSKGTKYTLVALLQA